MMTQRFIIVSGLSGAGKTIALHALEDAGFYCVDNLPVGLLADFAGFVGRASLPHYDRVAVGIDARNPESDLKELPAILGLLKSNNLPVEVLFVEATDQALINRFSETRRRQRIEDIDAPS